MTSRLRSVVPAATALLGLLAVVLVCLHIPAVQDRVARGLLEMAASRVDGELSVRRASYRLWLGEVTLERLHYESRADGFRVDARIPRLVAHVGPRSGLELSVAGPVVAISSLPGTRESAEDPEPATGPPSPPLQAKLPGFVSLVTIDSGRIRWQDEAGDAHAELGPFDLELQSEGARELSGRLIVEAGVVRLDDEPLHILGGSARLDGDASGLHVEEGRFDLDAGTVRSEADIATLDPLEGDLVVDFSLEGADLSPFIGEPSFGGHFQGTVSLSVRADSVAGNGEMSAVELSWRELGPVEAGIRWRLDADALHVESLTVDGYGGTVEADARLELAERGRQTAEIRWNDVSVPSLMAALGWDVSVAEYDRAWNARSNGRADLAVERWRVETLSGTSRLDFEGDLSGRIVASADRGDVTARTEGLSLPGGELRFEAELDALRNLAAELRLELDEVGRLAARVAPDDWARLEGGLIVDGTASGNLDQAETFRASAVVKSESLVVNERALDLHGGLRYSDETIHIEDVAARASARGREPADEREDTEPEGSVTASGTIPLAPHETASVALSLESFPLGLLPRRLGIESGSLSGEIELVGDIRNPDGEAGLTFEHIEYRGVESSGRLSATRRNGIVRFAPLLLRLDGDARDGEAEDAELSAEGSFDPRTRAVSLQAVATGIPLHETAPNALPGAGWPPALRAVLARAHVTLSGTVDRPEGNATLRFEDVAFRGEALPDVSATVLSTGAGEAETEIRLEPGGSLLQAKTELVAPYPTTLTVELSSIPWDVVVRAFDVRNVESVRVAGRIESRLPLTKPEELVGEAKLSEMSASISGSPVGIEEPFSVLASANRVEVSSLSLVGDGIDLDLEGVVNLESAGRETLTARGAIDLAPWARLVPGDSLAGNAQLDLTFGGTFDRPRLRGSVSVEGGRWANGPLVVENARLGGRANGTSIVLERLDALVLGGRVEAEGAFPLPGANDEEYREPGLSFRASELDLAPLLIGSSEEAAARGAEASVSITGEARLRSASIEGVDASGAVTEVTLRSAASGAASASPASFRLSGGRFELDPLRITGEGTDLSVGATGSLSDWSASARGDLNLLLGSAVLPSSVVVTGALRVDARVSGGDEGIRVGGTSALQTAELVLESPPLVVSSIDAAFRFADRDIVLESLSASASGGTLDAEGSLSIGGDATSSLRIQARGVRMEYPDGLRSVVDAELDLAGGGGDRAEATYDLSGRVVIDEARFERDLSVERELLRSIRNQTVELASEPGFASRLRLDVNVDTLRDVVVDNNLGQIRAEVNVLVTGTGAAPEISGTVRAREGGELHFAGNEYDVQTARVDLVGYPASAPEVEVRARTEAGGYDLELSLSGPLDNLRTELSSPGDPSLSRADVASLLLTGRTLEGVRGDEGRVVGEQAARYLGGGLAEITESGLEQALPVTSVSIAPTVVGSETDPGARLSLGQALSDDLFLTYSLGLNDTQSQLWIIDYDLPKGFAVRAVRDDQNEYTGTLSQRVLFDLHERQRPVELGEIQGPEIRAVRIEGSTPPAVPAQELQKASHLSEGERFDYWRAREDADAMGRELREAGYLGAQVRVDAEPVEGSEEVDLVYTVQANVPIDISWSGDDPGDSLKKKVRESWGAHLPARAVARQATRLVTRTLQSEGYFEAVVESDVSESEDRTEVRFHVERGVEGSGVELDFTGNDVLEEEDLEALFPDPSTAEFFRILQEKEADLRESVQLYYATEGYLDARVTELSERFDPSTGIYHVAIAIDEGEPSYVEDVVLEGVESLPEEAVRERLVLEPGSLLRLGDFLENRQAIGSFYRGEGFPDAKVRSRLERSGAGFDAVYEVEENDRVVVGEIRITGNRVTDEALTRRTLRLSPGAPLRLEDLIETQSRLYDLQAFRSVDVRAVPTGRSGVSDVVVDLVERPDVNLSYGLRYSTEELWEVTGSVDLPNLFGDARRLNFSAFVNRNDQAFRGTYSVPYFFGLDLDTALFVERELQTDDTLASRSWALTFQQGRGKREGIRSQWSYTFRRAVVDASAEPGDPFGFHVAANRGLLTGSLIHDSRNSLTSPSRGWFWNATAQVGAALLGSDLRFLRFYGQAFYFRPVIGRGIVWASSYRAGVAKPFEDQVLLPGDRFQAGGPNSVRGFPLDELGPEDPSVGATIGGEGVLVMNQELRIPVWRRFGAVVFYDTGNVYLDVRDFDPLDLRHSLGVGVRVALPFGLARVDWARVLNPQPGLDTSRLHISFGHAF